MDAAQVQREEMLHAEKFGHICKKICQAFSLRVKLMNRRVRILQSVDSNFWKIGQNPNFYSELDATLAREEKIIRILKSEEGEAKTQIDYALSELENAERIISGTGDLYFDAQNKKVSTKEIEKFLGDVIYFLTLTQRVFSEIERRMELERVFLNEKNPDKKAAYFQEFIKNWKHEQKINKKLMKQYEKALRRNYNTVIQADKSFRPLFSRVAQFLVAPVGIPLIDNAILNDITSLSAKSAGSHQPSLLVLVLIALAAGIVLSALISWTGSDSPSRESNAALYAGAMGYIIGHAIASSQNRKD